jgi:23S rRNA (adenine1618-N6)-methyltransferase
MKKCSELETFVSINEHNIETIDFSNPEAVKALKQGITQPTTAFTTGTFLKLSGPPIPGSRLHPLYC